MSSDRHPNGPAGQSWEQTFPNTLAALMRVNESMGAFLGDQSFPVQAIYHAQLAVEEIGTNIIKYGYDDRQEHPITLRVECGSDAVRLRFLDDGRPFDVRQVPEPDPGLSLDERKAGGWGISLVRRLSRSMDYERRDGRNVLTLELPRDGGTL